MSVQFAVLASGSRGNATLVQTGGAGLLLDVGIGPRALAHRLESVGSSWDRIAAALLTHTHGDHLDDATLQGLARRGVPLYCHEGHRAELGLLAGFRVLEAAGLVRSYETEPFLTPTGLRVEPVPLLHDSGPTFGFRVEAKAKPGACCPTGRTGLRGRHRNMVGPDGRGAGRRRSPGGGVQPRRRDAARLGTLARPDRSGPGRPWAPLERPGGRLRARRCWPVRARAPSGTWCSCT